MANGTGRGRGNTWVGALAGILVGLLAVVIGFFALRTGPTTATPSPSPTASTPPVAASHTPSMPTSTPTSVSPSPTPTRTATPTPTPSETPSPSPSETPSPSPSSASPSSTYAPGLVTQLRSGSYIAVIRSLPKQTNSAEEAVAYAKAQSRGGQTLVAIDSDKVGGLRDGFYAIAVPNLTDYQQVKAACAAMGLPNGDRCFPRTIP
ncbi:hypothetical protein [Nigerium massiliense]|uniref:hypothetical protein n=1 Tax=Nigerium massiliense TaxID=1522317 RepID=UPI00058E6AAA|nr:hypothetical protein [Nigerium massiliense]